MRARSPPQVPLRICSPLPKMIVVDLSPQLGPLHRGPGQTRPEPPWAAPNRSGQLTALASGTSLHPQSRVPVGVLCSHNAEFNRQLQRIGFILSCTKQSTGTEINRQLFRGLPTSLHLIALGDRKIPFYPSRLRHNALILNGLQVFEGWSSQAGSPW